MGCFLILGCVLLPDKTGSYGSKVYVVDHTIVISVPGALQVKSCPRSQEE